MYISLTFVLLLLFLVGLAAGLVDFIADGAVLWREGLIMGAGQFIGAGIGARMVVSRGTCFIRPVFITMVLAITAKLIWLNYHRVTN
jgi:uncharacterized membrane protein YfcA